MSASGGRDPGREAADEGKREMRLPSAGPASPDTPGANGGPGAPTREPDTSAYRLVSTLALAGAVAGLVIVLVHQWTDPLIQENRARVLREAVYEVLGGPEHYETAFLVGDAFTTEPPPGTDTATAERVYVGFDESGGPVGVAVAGQKAGFQDIVLLIFGYDPTAGEVLGMKVLENKETPGLGDKIVKDSAFVSEFEGATTPLEGVKAGSGGGDANEVDMITGATISSRAVIDIINARLELLAPRIESWWRQGIVPTTPVAGTAIPASDTASAEASDPSPSPDGTGGDR